MRNAFLFTLLAVASFSVAAQQDKRSSGSEQQSRSSQNAQNADDKAAEDAALKERTRLDGAAGGTAPVPEEKRRAVGAGAGPHLKDTLPSPTKLPRDEPVEPPK